MTYLSLHSLLSFPSLHPLYLCLLSILSSLSLLLSRPSYPNRYLDSTKMEAASFQIFDKSSMKFQVSDPDAYYVHHMSRYEHSIHRKRGYAVAQNQTLILSNAAVLGECDNLVINPSREYLALIPFYGGLPPDLTADMKVKSIGQGNSLVSIRCA